MVLVSIINIENIKYGFCRSDVLRVTGAQYHAAAEDLIPVVKHGGLSGRHGALRRVEIYSGARPRQGNDPRGLLPLAVARFHRTAYLAAWRLAGYPVHVAQHGKAAVKLLLIAEDDGVILRAYSDDVFLLRQGEAEAAVLPDGIAYQPGMAAEDAPARVDKIAPGAAFSPVCSSITRA